MYTIVVAPHAVRDFKKIPQETLKRIDRALLSLCENPYPSGIKFLRHPAVADYRVRIGNYRVLFDIDHFRKIIVILRVGHRKNVYR